MVKNRKWLLSLVLAVVAILGMAFANSGSASAATTSNNPHKILIVYFSMSGNTKQAAKQIQRDTGGDIVRLRRATPYPKGYDNYARVANRERKQGIHPAIKRNLPDLKNYDTVMIGFPTWWQQPPMVIHTLFDDYNFSGKTIIPFTTSMSTPMKNSMPTMRQLASADGANIKNGFRYNYNNAALRRFLAKDNLLR